MKKILCTVICFALIICCASPAISAADNSQVQPPFFSFFVFADGIAEIIERALKSLDRRMNYGEYEALCDIPELDKGYVPQGFCYIDSMDVYAVTAYAADKASIITFIDGENGQRLKTVSLGYEDGSVSKAHAGGIADIGDSLIVTIGDCIKRIRLSDVAECDDYSTVVFTGSLQTDLTSCSYACSYGDLLLVGEFYVCKTDSSYIPKPGHFSFISFFERSYAYCEVMDMSDLDKAFSQEKPEVEYVIAMPNSVQGVAFDGETLVTAVSYGRNNDSYLRYYDLSKAQAKTTEVYGSQVELLLPGKSCITSSVTLPPLLEGIDMHGEKVAGIFESGAEKYSDSKFIVNSICDF